MKTSLERLKNSRVKIEIQLEWDEFAPYIERAQKKFLEKIQVKGFRPGKAPQELVKDKVSQEVILSEAADEAAKKAYIDFVEENNLDVIGRAQTEVFSLGKGKPFGFRVLVDVFPEIELPDYREIAQKIEKPSLPEVSEKEVTDTLSWIQKSRAKFEPTNQPAKQGDFVEIEYQILNLGEKWYRDEFLLGKGGFVSGFEENLQGMNQEETREFEIDFPKNWSSQKPENKELAGKTVKFRVTMKKISQMILHPLDDDFARKLGNFENLEALKKSVKEGIAQEKEIDARNQRRSQIIQEIVKQTEIELPESLIEAEKEEMLQDLKARVDEALKVPFEEYLKSIQKSEEELKESLSESARQRLKETIVLRAIGRRENIKVSDEEVLSRVNEFLKNYPSIEKAEKELDLERLREYYRDIIFNEKVLQLLDSL